MINTSEYIESHLRIIEAQLNALSMSLDDPAYGEDERGIISMRVEALENYRDLCVSHLTLLETGDFPTAPT